MPVLKMHVVYTDGRTEDFLVPPRVQVMAEEFFRSDGGIGGVNALKSHYYTAWLALHRAGKESATFETWLDSIDDATAIDENQLNGQPGDG
jgi:hypothetical protein